MHVLIIYIIKAIFFTYIHFSLQHYSIIEAVHQGEGGLPLGEGGLNLGEAKGSPVGECLA